MHVGKRIELIEIAGHSKKETIIFEEEMWTEKNLEWSVELVSVFNSESKSISTLTIQKELKG